jgi:hypothetical protein
MEVTRNKRLLIIQPGKFGDIIICLPIAYWYFLKYGYDVYWECPGLYHEIFRNIDYVTPVENAITEAPYEKIIDLSFGFGGAPQMWWNERQTKFDSFVTAKYELAGVPLEQRWNLNWKQGNYSERELFKHVTPNDAYKYNLVHVQGSIGTSIEERLTGQEHKIMFKPVEGYNIFDWYEVINCAEEIHCIDSSLANFIEVVPEFRDIPKYLYDVRESYHWLKSIYKNNWTIIT